jgi:hypothetical protein
MPLLQAATRNARRLAGVFFLSALSGCAIVIPQTQELRTAWPADLPERVELSRVPFFPQTEYQCGPAALATALVHSKVAVTPDELIPQVYIPARQGSLQVEMLATPRRYGMVSYQLAPRMADVLREVAAGNPVIVLQNYGVKVYGANLFPLWHYAVVAGYDRAKGEVVLRSGEKQHLAMPFMVLEYTWENGDHWAMVTMPPDRIPVTATEDGYIAAIAAMERVGKPRAAIAAYSNFLQRWQNNLAAHVGLANAHYAMGELKAAEEVLRRAVARHPDSVVVLNNLAQTLSDQKRNEEALTFVERALKIGGPFAATVRETRNAILQRMGREN